MAHVFYDVVAVCCAVLVSCAVVCDALCSALLLQSALDGLEPLSLGLIKFRTWHLRIRKNMKFKSQRPAGEDVWGGPAALLAPGQARSTRARIFSQRSPTNTNPIHRARPAGRPVGSACGFLSRTDAGQVPLEPTANGSRRETSLNHRHFVGAHRYRMARRAPGGFRRGCSRQASCVSISMPAWCPGCSRLEGPNNIALIHRIAAQLV